MPFLVLGYVLLFVTALAILGVVRIALSGARSERYLEASGVESPLALDHLPGPLRRFATDTRLLRISLEGPVFQISEYRRGALDRRVEDPEVLERLLTDVQRQVTEWTVQFERVQADHPEPFEDAGISASGVRRLTDEGQGTFDRERLLDPQDAAYDRLVRLVESMRRIEDALQRTGRVYR